MIYDEPTLLVGQAPRRTTASCPRRALFPIQLTIGELDDDSAQVVRAFCDSPSPAPNGHDTADSVK